MGTKWYTSVLTHPCSSMLHACSGLSLVGVLSKVKNLLERGVEFLSHVVVVTGRVVLCPIVSYICVSRLPEEVELVMVDAAVMEPVETHVHGFGLFGLDMTVDDVFRSAVVSLDRCRRLKVT